MQLPIRELPPRPPEGYARFSSYWSTGHRLWMMTAWCDDEFTYHEAIPPDVFMKDQMLALQLFRKGAIAANERRKQQPQKGAA